MHKKSSFFLITILNILVCITVLTWLFKPEQTVQAQAPQAFLGTIYYGNAPVTTLFDHQFPLTFYNVENGCGDTEDDSNPL